VSRICLLVGNGFSKDLVRNLNLQTDPSSPLTSFNNPNINFDKFIEKLPLVKNELLPLLNDGIKDFDAINIYLENAKIEGEEAFNRKECQLRRFLALAFSEFQVDIEKHNFSNWKWLSWLKKHNKNMVCMISFNYDLILEKAIKQSEKKFRRVGVREEKMGIPIIKPHGSIDFEIPHHNLKLDDETIWSTTFTGKQFFQDGKGYIEAVPYENWFKPRLQPDLIPPSQYNYNKHLDWVKDGFSTFEQVASNGGVDTFVIVGHSYSEVDREEIEDYIKCLTKRSEFYIVNPNNKCENVQQLITFIKKQGHQISDILEFDPPNIV
jgi:hypothetical protein